MPIRSGVEFFIDFNRFKAMTDGLGKLTVTLGKTRVTVTPAEASKMAVALTEVANQASEDEQKIRDRYLKKRSLASADE
jgi:hypothetical protein